MCSRRQTSRQGYELRNLIPQVASTVLPGPSEFDCVEVYIDLYASKLGEFIAQIYSFVLKMFWSFPFSLL